MAQSCGIFRLHFCNVIAWTLNRAKWLAYLCSNCFRLWNEMFGSGFHAASALLTQRSAGKFAFNSLSLSPVRVKDYGPVKHGVTQLYKPKWARQNCTQNPSEVNHEETSRATCHQLSLWKNSEEKCVKMSSQRVDGRPRFL